MLNVDHVVVEGLFLWNVHDAVGGSEQMVLCGYLFWCNRKETIEYFYY